MTLVRFIVVLTACTCAASHTISLSRISLSSKKEKSSQAPVLPPAPSPSPQAAVVAAAPAGSPPAIVANNAVVLNTPQAAPAQPELSPEDVEDLADAEAKEEGAHLQAAAASATANQVAAIDHTANQAKLAGSTVVAKERDAALAEQVVALHAMETKHAKDIQDLTLQTKDQAEDTLLKVKDNSEIASTEAARQAVDDVESHAKNEAREVIKEAQTMKDEAAELAQKALKAADVASTAARTSQDWVRQLPKKEAENATRLALLSQEIAAGLKNQARLVLTIAKLAEASAAKSLNVTKLAEETAKSASKTLLEAAQQADQNARLLKTVTVQSAQARKDGVEASNKARKAVEDIQKAKVAVRRTAGKKAEVEMRKQSTEQESDGLLQVKHVKVWH